MRRKAFKNIAVAFIAVLVAFTSCKKEDKELSIENDTIEFTLNPMESKTVTIHSNTDWSVEIQQVGEWLSVSPAMGKNDGTLTLTAQVNDDFAERYATITVNGADVKKTIAVMQEGDKRTIENETVTFTIHPTESKTVNIPSMDWSIEIQQVGEWLSVTPKHGQNGTLTLSAQVNDDFAERYATITVNGAEVKKTIAIVQEGDKTKDVILLEKMQFIDHSRRMFEYDEKHRLKTCYYYNGVGTLNSTMTLTYNDEGDLTDVLWVDSTGYSIRSGPKINGNKISFWGVGIESNEVELNTDALPGKHAHKWQAQMHDSRATSTFTYKWVNRNLSNAAYIVNGVSYAGESYNRIGTYTFTYDDKKSPFYYCATPRWFWLWYFDNVTYCSLNNLIPAKTGNDTTTYEYNEDGFLATIKLADHIITYTYIRRAGTDN